MVREGSRPRLCCTCGGHPNTNNEWSIDNPTAKLGTDGPKWLLLWECFQQGLVGKLWRDAVERLHVRLNSHWWTPFHVVCIVCEQSRMRVCILTHGGKFSPTASVDATVFICLMRHLWRGKDKSTLLFSSVSKSQPRCTSDMWSWHTVSLLAGTLWTSVSLIQAAGVLLRYAIK